MARKKSNTYKMPWGTIEIKSSGFFICPDFRTNLWETFSAAEVFTENGRLGLRRGEKILLPAEFEQIETLYDGTVFIKTRGMYATFSQYRSMMGDSISDTDGFFVEKGKKGWRIAGKELFPAKYDSVEKWYGYDVYRLKNGKQVEYRDSKGNKVLEHVRKFDDAEDLYDEPFFQRFNDGDIFPTFQIVGKKERGRQNVVSRDDGQLVRVERLSRSEIIKALTNPSDDLSLTEKDLETFNSDFSYEYSAYGAFSTAKKPIDDILSQFAKLKVAGNSWYYLLKVSTAKGCRLDASQVKQLRKFFTDAKTRTIDYHVAIGEDASLKPGEVSAILVTHYHERCWPAPFEFEWSNLCETGTLEQIKEYFASLKDKVKEVTQSEYIESVYNDQLCNLVDDARGNRGKRNWKEVWKRMDYFKTIDVSFDPEKGLGLCGMQFAGYNLMQEATLKSLQYEYRMLEWMLNNGVNPNIVRNSSTLLDGVNYTIPQLERLGISEKKMALLLKVRDLLLKHGAKTYEQVCKEDGLSDYERELAFLAQPYRTTKFLPINITGKKED